MSRHDGTPICSLCESTEAKRFRQSHFPHSSVFPPIDPSRIGCMSSWWQQAANALHAAGAAASEAAAEQQRLHQALNATGAEICKLQRQVLQVSMYAACFSHPCRCLCPPAIARQVNACKGVNCLNFHALEHAFHAGSRGSTAVTIHQPSCGLTG